MNSDQINYAGQNNFAQNNLAQNNLGQNSFATANNTFPAANNTFQSVDTTLPHTTAHSFTVNKREERFLSKEQKKEAKRALRQEKVANKLATKADRQFSKAADKASTGGMFSERSAMRHEEKAVKLAAASNFHRQAASESQSEASRAEILSSLPPRGTLPASAQSSVPLGGSGGIPLSGTSSYNPIV